MRGTRLLRLMASVLGATAVVMTTAGAAGATTVDPWAEAADVINTAFGSPCSVTGTTPSKSTGPGIQMAGESVTASGTMTCSGTWDVIGVTVCIQVRQAVVPENLSWQTERCNSAQRTNASTVTATVSAPCLPGRWKYRTTVVGEAHRLGSRSISGAYADRSGVTIECTV